MGWPGIIGTARHFGSAGRAEAEPGPGPARRGSGAAGAGASLPGLVAGTAVATPEGWRPVEALSVGARVLTFDGGAQEIRHVSRRLWPGPGQAAPQPLVRLPAGLVGNAAPLMLMPGQDVMVESDAAEEAWGDPFALVRASALVGTAGGAYVLPEAPVTVVTLGCTEDEMLFVAGQAVVHAEAAGRASPWTLDEAVAAGRPRYRTLDEQEARLLTAELGMARRQESDLSLM